MIVTCGDTECQYYNINGCIAPAVHHTDERFCVTGKKKQPQNYKQLMRESEPSGYKSNGKWIGNKIRNMLK